MFGCVIEDENITEFFAHFRRFDLYRRFGHYIQDHTGSVDVSQGLFIGVRRFRTDYGLSENNVAADRGTDHGFRSENGE